MWDDELEQLTQTYIDRFGDEELKKLSARVLPEAQRAHGRPIIEGLAAGRGAAMSATDFHETLRAELRKQLTSVH